MDFYGLKPDPDDPRLICEECLIPLEGLENGFYHCESCGFQSQDIVQTVADEDDLHATGGVASLYNDRFHRKSQPFLIQPITKIGPSEPQDFPSSIPVSPGDLASGIRERYVRGLQLVLQRQCAALVERFGVSPIVAGLVGTLWLKFVAASRVFDEGWPERAVAESEAAFVAAANDELVAEKCKKRIRAKQRSEPHNRYGQRYSIIWFYALRRALPVYSTLAISYLACHIAREAILPTDISKWAEEGKLPYLTVFMEIDKIPLLPSSVCPFSSKFMFRYFRVVGAWELEATAGSIAHTIGLRLPSVNFYGIVCRYLKELSLPVEKILPHACRLYQWSMPPDLWLSANVHRLPTRVCVMAILIVTVRILYNIHGQGFWEKNLPGTSDSNIGTQKVNSSCCSEAKKRKRGGDEKDLNDVDYDTKYSAPVKNLSAIQGSDFNATELLHILETVYDKIRNTSDYSKDLLSYLEYCQEIAFAGRIHSSEEERLIERLWEIYKKQEGNNKKVDTEKPDTKEKNLRDELCTITSLVSKESGKETRDSPRIDEKKLLNKDGFVSTTDAPPGDVAIGNMKLDMEEHGFEYLSPKSKLISTDYLHYMRKKVDGKLNYVAHTDYYILLRACARLAQVDVRVMHLGVLKLERRLKWTEQQIDSCLR